MNDSAPLTFQTDAPQKIMQGDGTTPDDGRMEVYKDGPDEDGKQFENDRLQSNPKAG